MLDQKDLEILKNMMESVVDERLAKSEETILDKVDERFAKSEEMILDKVDERLANSENLVLSEMERTREILERQINRIEDRMESMQHDINACKLEKGTLDILIKKTDQLEKRLEELERKSA